MGTTVFFKKKEEERGTSKIKNKNCMQQVWKSVARAAKCVE